MPNPKRTPAPHSPADPALRARRAPQPKPAIISRLPSAFKWLAAATLFIVLLCPVGLLLSNYAYVQLFERILPGVRVSNTSLGGKSVYQAAVWLNKDWNMEYQIAVGWLVDDKVQSEYLSPAQLGLSLDVVKTAQNAYALGHGQSFSNEIGQLARSWFSGWEIAPLVNFDPQTARAGLETLAEQVSISPRNAALRIEGTAVIVSPATPGATIDIEATLTTLAADPSAIMLNGYLLLPIEPVSPSIGDVSAAAAEAERLLDTPLHLTGYDPITDEYFDWPVSPETVGEWLKVESDVHGSQVTIDTDRLAVYLAALRDGLGAEQFIDAARYAQPLAEAIQHGNTMTIILSHNPTGYTVQPGDTLLRLGWNLGIPYWRITQANPGLDPEKLNAGQQLIIPSKDDLLPLPVIPNKRIVIGISQQHLWTYQDRQLRSEHIISTGMDRSPTQPGVFQVQTHELIAYASVWDLYMPHFLGIYEAWPGFMNGIHGLPTLSNGVRLWESILGRPASFGCIILDLQAAEDLYPWAEEGVVVEIRP